MKCFGLNLWTVYWISSLSLWICLLSIRKSQYLNADIWVKYVNMICLSELLKFNIEAVNDDLSLSEFQSVYFSKNVMTSLVFVPVTSCMSSVFCIEIFRVKGKGIFSWLITGRCFIIETGLIGLFSAPLLPPELQYTWKWHSELTATRAVGAVLEVFASVSPYL